MTLQRIGGLALGGLLLLGGPPAGAEPARQETPPDPNKIVARMCDYLKSLQRFSFSAEVTDDQVYTDGKKLQFGFDTQNFVQRPDRMRVNAVGDVIDKQFFLNGKTVTLYDPADKVYATAEVPADIEGALAQIDDKLGFRAPLADLASPDLCTHLGKDQRHALFIGTGKVRGVAADHLAFDRDDVQVQVWIATGARPLPVKILINQKNLPASPQWTAYLHDWNTAPNLKASTFTFTAPPGAKQIKFVPPTAAASPAATAPAQPAAPAAAPADQPAAPIPEQTGAKP